MGVSLKKLEKIVQGKKNVLILIYGNPDPDALASAWGVKELFQGMGASSTIAYTGEVGRLQNASVIQLLRLPVAPLNGTDIQKADLIAMVDSQPEFFKNFDLPRCDVVIDHHPKKSDKKVAYSDIRPNCLATSSIVTEYLMSFGRPISRRLATALYYGIESDSRGQQRGPSPADSAALRALERKANRNLVSRIEFSQYSLNDLDYFSIALVKHRFARNVLYAHIGAVPSSDVCVQVADFLMRVKEAHWALVTGVAEDRLTVVFRCDGHLKNAGKVAALAFGNQGSAGGHRTMGRAEIPAENLPPEVRLTKNERLEWFVVNALARVDAGFRPLLRLLRAEGFEPPAAKTSEGGGA